MIEILRSTTLALAAASVFSCGAEGDDESLNSCRGLVETEEDFPFATEWSGEQPEDNATVEVVFNVGPIRKPSIGTEDSSCAELRSAIIDWQIEKAGSLVAEGEISPTWSLGGDYFTTQTQVLDESLAGPSPNADDWNDNCTNVTILFASFRLTSVESLHTLLRWEREGSGCTISLLDTQLQPASSSE